MQRRLTSKARLRAAGALVVLSAAAAMAAADGSWLRKVSPADHTRGNPYAGQTEAIVAGRQVYLNNCAKCHGANAEGKHGRPGLRSERIATASDGDLAWILKNGNPFKGMPSWSSLPEQQRWQAVAYVRSLQSLPAAHGGGR